MILDSSQEEIQRFLLRLMVSPAIQILSLTQKSLAHRSTSHSDQAQLNHSYKSISVAKVLLQQKASSSSTYQSGQMSKHGEALHPMIMMLSKFQKVSTYFSILTHRHCFNLSMLKELCYSKTQLIRVLSIVLLSSTKMDTSKSEQKMNHTWAT